MLLPASEKRVSSLILISIRISQNKTFNSVHLKSYKLNVLFLKSYLPNKKTPIINDNQGLNLFLVRNDAEKEGFEPPVV